MHLGHIGDRCLDQSVWSLSCGKTYILPRRDGHVHEPEKCCNSQYLTLRLDQSSLLCYRDERKSRRISRLAEGHTDARQFQGHQDPTTCWALPHQRTRETSYPYIPLHGYRDYPD